MKYTIYQPQIDNWDGYNFEAHAAVSVLPAGGKEQIFGVVEISAKTAVARGSRTVHFRDVKVVKATFPSRPDKGAARTSGRCRGWPSTGPRDDVAGPARGLLAINGEREEGARRARQERAAAFVFSQTAAVLVSIDGAPVWRGRRGRSSSA